MPDREEPIENFCDIVRSINKSVMDLFNGAVDDALVPGANWTVDNERSELEETLEKRIAIERTNQLKKMKDFIAVRVGASWPTTYD